MVRSAPRPFGWSKPRRINMRAIRGRSKISQKPGFLTELVPPKRGFDNPLSQLRRPAIPAVEFRGERCTGIPLKGVEPPPCEWIAVRVHRDAFSGQGTHHARTSRCICQLPTRISEIWAAPWEGKCHIGDGKTRAKM